MAWIRNTMVTAVAAVAAFAAIISYSHIYALGRAHGGAGLAPWLLPLAVDGIIVAASMLMLHEALSGRQAPRLARVMLAAGIAATIAANVAYGLGWGWLGAVIWAWPSLAFVGSVELLITLLRRMADQVAEASPGSVPPAVPADAESAAAEAFRATWLAGNPWSRNALADRFGLTRGQAQSIIDRYRPELVSANGDGH